MQQINFCNALYSLHTQDINNVEAVTLSVLDSVKKFNVALVINYKDFYTKSYYICEHCQQTVSNYLVMFH
jgi:hypothetical protein